MAKPRFYVVWKGRSPGIYRTWDDCAAQVEGFPGAQYKAFDSQAAAEVALGEGYQKYRGRPASSGAWKRAAVKPQLPSICVDAACAGAPGPVEYRAVLTEDGQLLFQAGPFAGGTNNIGEFLAIVRAFEWLQEQMQAYPVYSDSEVALGWVRAGRCRTQLARTPDNTALFYMIARAEKWLAAHPAHPAALKWDTGVWGEIPADYGRK